MINSQAAGRKGLIWRRIHPSRHTAAVFRAAPLDGAVAVAAAKHAEAQAKLAAAKLARQAPQRSCWGKIIARLYAANANVFHHIFGQSKEVHELLRPLVARYGSEQAALKAIQQAVVETLQKQGRTAGLYTIEVVVGGMKIRVSGRIIDGVVRIGSAWVNKPR